MGIRSRWRAAHMKDPMTGVLRVTNNVDAHRSGFRQNLVGVLVVDGLPPTPAEVPADTEGRWVGQAELPVLVDRADPTHIQVLWDQVIKRDFAQEARYAAMDAVRRMTEQGPVGAWEGTFDGRDADPATGEPTAAPDPRSGATTFTTGPTVTTGPNGWTTVYRSTTTSTSGVGGAVGDAVAQALRQVGIDPNAMFQGQSPHITVTTSNTATGTPFDTPPGTFDTPPPGFATPDQFGPQPGQFGTQPSQSEPQPGTFDTPPAGFGATPNQFGPQPGQFGTQPGQFEPQPDQPGTQPSQFGAQPGGFTNAPGQFGFQPGAFGAQPGGITSEQASAVVLAVHDVPGVVEPRGPGSSLVNLTLDVTRADGSSYSTSSRIGFSTPARRAAVATVGHRVPVLVNPALPQQVTVDLSRIDLP
jgi:hypothetical protein